MRQVHFAAAAEQRAQRRERHHRQDQDQDGLRGQAAAQEGEDVFRKALVDRKGDQRGRLALGVDAREHVLVQLHVEALRAVALRNGLNLLLHGEVFLIPDEGVGGLLDIDRRVEAVQRQAHQDEREHEPDDQQQQAEPVGLLQVGISHDSSSFRMTVTM